MAAGKKEFNGSAEASRVKDIKQDESKEKRFGKESKSYGAKVRGETLKDGQNVKNVDSLDLRMKTWKMWMENTA